jgi:hypothetical protein
LLRSHIHRLACAKVFSAWCANSARNAGLSFSYRPRA